MSAPFDHPCGHRFLWPWSWSCASDDCSAMQIVAVTTQAQPAGIFFVLYASPTTTEPNEVAWAAPGGVGFFKYIPVPHNHVVASRAPQQGPMRNLRPPSLPWPFFLAARPFGHRACAFSSSGAGRHLSLALWQQACPLLLLLRQLRRSPSRPPRPPSFLFRPRPQASHSCTCRTPTFSQRPAARTKDSPSRPRAGFLRPLRRRFPRQSARHRWCSAAHTRLAGRRQSRFLCRGLRRRGCADSSPVWA